MNVLFVYYIPSGGVETLNRQRAAALKQRNMNCHFLYYVKKREMVNAHDGPVFITNNDHEIKQILHEGNYSAIIITSDYKGLARFRSLGYQGKLIFEIQGFGPQHIARAELMEAIPYVAVHGDGILTSETPHIIQILQELYPSFPKFIFHNCFDTGAFSYKALPKSNKPIIAWIGRIEENKNWQEFLEIGHQLISEHNPNIQLYMFEDATLSAPEERKKFQKMIKRLNLEQNLIVHSNVPHDQMAEYFSIIGDSGGFLCSTSKVESFGYAIVEAMSCRCPVVTTDSDGVRSSVIHNRTGKYYTLGNIDQAVREAKELMTNDALRKRICSTAFRHVKTNFSPERYAKNFSKMLKNLGVQ
ncbi:MAG: glycosyltransferase family 4 protein [Ectobacillus sp.]